MRLIKTQTPPWKLAQWVNQAMIVELGPAVAGTKVRTWKATHTFDGTKWKRDGSHGSR